MTDDVAACMIRATDESRARTKRLLTALSIAAVESGYLSVDALRAFRSAGFEVASLLNLHAKVVLVDRRWGLIGSGNLTRAGAGGGNAELGIVLGPSQARAAQSDFFDLWWRDSEPLQDSWLSSLSRRQPANPGRAGRRGHGGIHRVAPDPELASVRAGRSGLWLKLVYGTRMADGVFRQPWINDHDRLKPDGSPGGRTPGYEVGDHLVIYVTRGEQARCPAIVRVTAAPVLDSERVTRERGEAEARQWPWVTEVEVVHSVPLADGPTLDDIGVGRSAIHQHDHIRLVPVQYRRAVEGFARARQRGRSRTRRRPDRPR